MKKVKITAKTKKPTIIKKKTSISIIEDDEAVGSIDTKRKNFFEIQNDYDRESQEMYGMNYEVFIVPKYLTQVKDIKYQILDYLNDSQLLPIQRNTKTFEYDGKTVEILPGFERFNKTQTLTYIQTLYNRIISEALRKGENGKECVICCQEIIRWIDILILDTQNKEIQQYLATAKLRKKEKEKDLSTLKDIWDSEEILYENVITFLQKEYYSIHSSFVTNKNNKLSWNKTVIGYYQYLAGFIYMCMRENCISKDLKSPKIVDILVNTFDNIEPSKNPFKALYKNPPADIYLIPFKNLRNKSLQK